MTMPCPICGSKSHINETRHKPTYTIRRRECTVCLQRFTTREQIVLSKPDSRADAHQRRVLTLNDPRLNAAFAEQLVKPRKSAEAISLNQLFHNQKEPS